jgi:hypothetical protein
MIQKSGHFFYYKLTLSVNINYLFINSFHNKHLLIKFSNNIVFPVILSLEVGGYYAFIAAIRTTSIE